MKTIELTLRAKFSAALTARGYSLTEGKRFHTFRKDGEEPVFISSTGLIRRGPSERKATLLSKEEASACSLNVSRRRRPRRQRGHP